MSLFTSDVPKDADPIYKHLVTLEDHRKQVSEDSIKEKIDNLWLKHEQKLEPKSKGEIKKHFYSVYWELFLCEFLTERNFNLLCRKPKGPDFNCTHPEARDASFYFEATSVKSGEGNNNAQIRDTKLSELKKGQPIPVHDYNSSSLILRITQGIQEKSKKLKKYLEDKIISDKNCLVIAIHFPGEIAFLEGPSGASIFHESVFAIGVTKIPIK